MTDPDLVLAGWIVVAGLGLAFALGVISLWRTKNPPDRTWPSPLENYLADTGREELANRRRRRLSDDEVRRLYPVVAGRLGRRV